MKVFIIVVLVVTRQILACPYHSRSVDNTLDHFHRRSTPTELSKTVINNVRVFDGCKFGRPQTVIIDQNKISFNPSNATETIDATGQFLIPGLIDNHVHIDSVEGLENATSYGLTTVMNMACHNYTLCPLLKNHPGLADFRTAGRPAIGPSSNHANSMGLPASRLVTDSSNTTELVDWAIGNSSDYYKITLEENGPSYDLTRRLIFAVHARGQQAMSHASELSAYQQAIDTYIDGIQHTPDDGNLTSAMLDQMNRSGQYVTPTLSVFAHALNPPSPAILTFLRGTSEPGNATWFNILHNVRAMYNAGIPLLAGTDSVGPLMPNITIPFGKSLHRELQYFVESVGMSPAEAINAATREAARYHGLKDRGRVEVGLRADLVLLGSDPLGDVKRTRDIKGV